LTSVSRVTGFTSVNACSQPGSVEVGTNTLLANVNGRMNATNAPGTACGLFTSRPTSTETQHRHSPNAIISNRSSTVDSGSVWIRKPSSAPNANMMTNDTA
jgi:hypothetical protein